MRHRTGKGPGQKTVKTVKWTTQVKYTGLKTGLTDRNVSGRAQEEVDDDWKKGSEEAVPGRQGGQQTVGQT